MKPLFKCIAGLLMLSVIGLYCPRVSFCAESGLLAKADQKPITRHEPKIMSAPEKKIPLSAAKTAERKKSPWLLTGLGAAALVGLAAIAAGSGGGSDRSKGGAGNGGVNISW